MTEAVPGHPVLVQKFGGTSVATDDCRRRVVEHVRRARDDGYRVAIVVSAMGRRGDPYATDTLLDLLRAGGGAVKPADYTLMFVTGEIMSVALVAHTLNASGVPAVGLSGAQARVFTDGHPMEADVVRIDVSRMRDHLDRGEVPVVAGGQGIEPSSFDFNTLGRGASDTSGVAIGVALGADRVEIFTDVEGVATGDPRVVPGATTIRNISFERMHELARYGAKVIHPRAVRAAWSASMPLVVRSTFSSAPGTTIGAAEGETAFAGVSSLPSLQTVVLGPGAVHEETLASWERRRVIMSLADADSGALVLGCADENELQQALSEGRVMAVRELGRRSWVSVIGDTAALAARALDDTRILADAGVRAEFSETGVFRSTFVVNDESGLRAVRLLHRAYDHTPCP